MKNIEKMTTLAIVLLVLSVPVVYAASQAAINVIVTGSGEASAHSIAKSSGDSNADATSEAIAFNGNSASAISKSDASGEGSIASATTKTINKDGDCYARASDGDIDTCVIGIGNIGIGNIAIGNIAIDGGPRPESILIGNVPVMKLSEGGISIATSEDGSSEISSDDEDIVAIYRYNDASVIQ